jgi:hypothetical protein
MSHEHVAGANRANFASENGGRPANPAVSHPMMANNAAAHTAYNNNSRPAYNNNNANAYRAPAANQEHSSAAPHNNAPAPHEGGGQPHESHSNNGGGQHEHR